MILPPPDRPPPDPFAWAVLSRLPLAESFYTIWGSLASDAPLDALFQQHRGRCYQDQLRFAELVAILADAITRSHGSGSQAITQALCRQGLSTQARAVYGKLARLPLPLAEAFLSTLTARLRLLFPEDLYRSQLPRCLDGLTVIVLDGKKIKRAAKRLLATRGRPGKLYGGKVLVAYLPASGLAVALAADPDGEANDIRLVPRVLPLARAAVAGPRLWVADRQFGDLEQPGRFAEDGDHFLIRYSKRTRFEADPQRPAQSGQDASGRAYTQEWGLLGAAAQGPRRRAVRRITLRRPGAEDVVLVTDLLQEQDYPALDLLEVYLLRWQIETVFQQITEVFELRHLIGCTPAATVFQAALCLVIYNILQLLRGYLAAGQPETMQVEVLSTEKIFRDLQEELISLHKVLTLAELVEVLGVPPSAEALRGQLQRLLGGLDARRWQKAPKQKPRPHPPKAKQSGAHTSVHKILQEAKRQKEILTPQRS